MTTDPWLIIAWLFVVLLVVGMMAVGVVIVWAIRQRRHFVAEFKRTSSEIERVHDEVAVPLRRSRGRFRIDPCPQGGGRTQRPATSGPLPEPHFHARDFKE